MIRRRDRALLAAAFALAILAFLGTAISFGDFMLWFVGGLR